LPQSADLPGHRPSEKDSWFVLFSLNNNGIMVLGSSETLGTMGNLFEPKDNNSKYLNVPANA
jgi:hypothetical protein